MQRLQSATLLVSVSISRDWECSGGRICAQITGFIKCESSLYLPYARQMGRDEWAIGSSRPRPVRLRRLGRADPGAVRAPQ